MINGEKIALMPYSYEQCHALYQNYISDPLMTHDPFHYEKQRVDQYYTLKVQDPTRCFFAIVCDGTTVGEIQLKYIHAIEKHGTLSIIIANDAYKNRGIGTEAIKLMLKHAAESLNFTKVYADAIHRNSRSQHVLESVGFKFIREDDVLKYYEIVLK